LQSVLQPPVVGSQGFDESVQGTGPGTSCARRSADRGGYISLESGPPALVNGRQGAGRSKVRKREDAEATRENLEFNNENTYLEDLPRGTGVDPQGLIQRIIERGSVVLKLLPQRLLRLGLVEVGRWRAGGIPLLLRARHGDIWGGEVGA
jgi:hypothetical protein